MTGPCLPPHVLPVVATGAGIDPRVDDLVEQVADLEQAVDDLEPGGGGGGSSEVPGLYHLMDFGDVDLTGVAPADAVLADALTAMYAAGGGTLVFPAGKILIEDQVVLPDDGGGIFGSDAQVTVPWQWQGQGAWASGQNSLGDGGTRIICTFQGAEYRDAKFLTRGLGQWEISGITFQDTTPNATTPILYTTNTTLRVHNNAFLGATGRFLCQQDAIVLGGTLKPTSGGYDDPDAPMQGYGTVIRENYFNRTRRAVYGRSYCNHVQVVFNFMDKDCGTNLVGGAVVEFDGGSLHLGPGGGQGDYCTANVVLGNYMHAIYYYYGVKVIKGTRHAICFNGFIDLGAQAISVCRFEGITALDDLDYPARTNAVIGNAARTDVHISEDTMSKGLNFLLTPGFTEPVNLGGHIKMPLEAKLIVDTPESGVASFALTDETTDYLKLGQANGGTWLVGGPVVLSGNPIGAGATTALSIGDHTQVSDAVLNLDAPTGRINQIQFKRNGVNSWLLYDGASTVLYVRDSVNAVMAMTLNPGPGVTGRVDFGGTIRVVGARVELGVGGPVDLAGAGTPEGAATAPVGSTYRRTNGAAGTTLYLKATGSGNTGWVTADSTAALRASNLSDLANAGTARTNLGLGNVTDTADSAKPVSVAQQAALDLKAPLASPTFTGTVAGLTKAMVGLSGVDNTADTAKPISSATQAALDAITARLASGDNYGFPLASGETTMNRAALAVGTQPASSGQLLLTYFTAARTETINNVTVITSGTAAAATPTLIRYGVYSVAGNGDLTLVASTASDTTLLAVANTRYTKALSAPWSKVAGQRYAVGPLVVTAAAMPTYWGIPGLTSAVVDTVFNIAPKISSVVGALADLPSSTAAGFASGTRRGPIYVEMT